MPDWELIITGCGVSHGNPPWGDPARWSTDPRDHRRRFGAVLRGPAGQVVLIDAGPDLMHQMRDPYKDWDGISYPARCITRCDGVILTHDHADHAHGLNDLRHLNRLMGGRSIAIHGHASHLAEIERMFPYCFGRTQEAYFQGLPGLVTAPLEDFIPTVIAGLPVTMVPMSHGPAGRVSGYRFGGCAFLTDLKELPPAADAVLEGVDLLVLDMLRDEPHATHLCWTEAQAIIARLHPRRTVLVHMGHEAFYADWERRLPADVVMAVDGMCFTIPVEG